MQFAGTEFSTPGASSKYLDEYQFLTVASLINSDQKKTEGQLSLLGVGGYAEVRLATHKKAGYKVAIKIYEKYKLIDVQIK